MPGETPPVEPKQVNSPGKQPENWWGFWLALSLLVIAVLFCIGQLALISPANIQAGDMRSGLKADYSLWPPLSFAPLEEALVEDLISDNPALPTLIAVSGNYWPTSSQPVVPTPTPSPTPMASPIAFATFPPVRPPATRVFRPQNTQVVVIPTSVPSATRIIPTNTQAPTETSKPGNPNRTPTPAATRTPTATLTYTATATFTRTATASNTPTPTPTSTNTSTPTRPSPPTHTATHTRTFTPTPTLTPKPLPMGFNLGTPDASYYNIACGSALVIDLGDPAPYIGTLIFNEYRNPIPSACRGGVCLDQVMIELSNSYDMQSSLWPQRIFYWGDEVEANNGSIPSPYYPPEVHNAAIAGADLYNNQGVQIHVDGVYRYIRVSPPDVNCSDPAQIDSIEIWAATMTPTPPP